MDTQNARCKVCGKDFKRMRAGRYPNGDIRYIETTTGSDVNGRTCSVCNIERVRYATKLRRRKERLLKTMQVKVGHDEGGASS